MPLAAAGAVLAHLLLGYDMNASRAMPTTIQHLLYAEVAKCSLKLYGSTEYVIIYSSSSQRPVHGA